MAKLPLKESSNCIPTSLILDLQMPIMNGLEAARHITRIAPAATVLMFTLHDSPQLMEEAHAGIRDVLSKSERVEEHRGA